MVLINGVQHHVPPGVEVRGDRVRVIISFEGKRQAVTVGKLSIATLSRASELVSQAQKLKSIDMLDRDTFKKLFPTSELSKTDMLEVAKSDPTFKDSLAEFKEHLKAEVDAGAKSLSTLHSYEKIIDKRLMVDLAPRKTVRQIDPQFIQQYERKLRKGECKSSNGEISQKTVNNILIVLSAFYTWLQKFRQLDYDPFEHHVFRSQRVPPPDVYSPEEMWRAINAARRMSLFPMTTNLFQFLFFTGMRLGEAIALDWRSVNIKEKVAYIEESRVKGVTGKTKTQKSVREVHLFDPAIEALTNQMRFSDRCKNVRIGSREWRPVFLNDTTNSYFSTDSEVRSKWRVFLKKTESRVIPLKNTRHSFATMMLVNNVNLFFLAEQLGHSNFDMLYRHYGRFLKKGAAAQHIASLNSAILDAPSSNSEEGAEF